MHIQDHSDIAPAAPWHQRVLDWLGLEPFDDEEDAPPTGPPALPERFPWEPLLLSARRRPQWGAADQPELLLGDP